MRLCVLNEIVIYSEYLELNKLNNCGVVLLSSICLYYIVYMLCDDLVF